MRPPSLWRFRHFQLVCALLALSCNAQTDVTSTIPGAHDDGVSPRSIIAIEVSNSITDKDTTATNPNNITVTGDLSDQPYKGTIELAQRKEVRHGMTVEDFHNRKKPSGAQTTTGKKQTASTNDTIVFLLPSGTSFKDGETIHVKVSDHITSHLTTIQGISFSFRVGSGSAQASELKICTTRPEPGALNESTRARPSAAFNHSVRADSLQGAITLRGSQSGVHTSAGIVTKADGQNRASEATLQLADDDAFLPGEWVDVSYSSGILEAGSGPASTAQKLEPYLFTFQAGGGQVSSDNLAKTSVSLAPSGDAGSLVAVLAADFRKKVDGVELVLVGESGLSLYAKGDGRSWTRTDAAIPLESQPPAAQDTFKAVDAAPYDTERNGIPKIIVLLAGSKGSRLQIFEVQSSGSLLPKDTINFPAVQVRKMLVADLDADGKPEILVSHPATTFIPSAGGKATSTGNLTIFHLVEVPPDPAKIKVGDPSTLKSTFSFERLDNPIPGFELSTRIEAADLNGDGMLDVIAQTDSGVTLYRNLGTLERPFNLRAVEHLEGRAAGSMLEPLAWVVADVDGDGSQDILAWDAAGVLSYRNHAAVRCPTDASVAPAATLLSEHVVPRSEVVGVRLSEPAQALALDLDGNGTMDIVVVKKNGDIALLLGEEGSGADGGALVFTAVDRPASPSNNPGASPTNNSEARGLAMADFDGDFGMDIAAVAASGGEVELRFSEGVTVPLVSSFEIDPLDAGTEVNGNSISVVVRGRIAEPYSGYSVALGYDKSLLKYRDFNGPQSDLVDSISRCPDAALQGCPGNASAQVTLKRPQVPSETDLGTFIFDIPAVTSPVSTTISLTSFTSNNTTFSNALLVTDGGSQINVPVKISGAPLEITLEPPPPSQLEAHSTVVARGVDLEKKPCLDCTVVHVSWSSPAGLLLSGLEVRAGGESVQVICLPGASCPPAFDFVTHLSGPISITLSAVDDKGNIVSAQGDDVVGIYRPNLTACEVSSGEIRVAWERIPDVDHYTIFRNSRFFITLDATATETTDTIPQPPPPTVTYEVAGELKGTRGPRGACVVEIKGDTDPGTTARPSNLSVKLSPRSAPSDPNTLTAQWDNGERYDDDGGIEVSLLVAEDRRVVFTQKVSGGSTAFTFEGDPVHGGVTPQDYIVSLKGVKNQRPSEAAESNVVKVPLPNLSVNLSCKKDNQGNVLVTWQDVWPGYDGLKLTIDDGKPQDFLFDIGTLSYSARGLDPSGSVHIQLEALYNLSTLPTSPPGQEPKLVAACKDLNFSTKVRVGRKATGIQIETGMGLSGIEVPLEATISRVVNDFELELEYPDFFQIDADPQKGIRLSDPTAQLAVFTPGQASTNQGRKKVNVKVTGARLDPNADGDGTDGKTLLVTLIGSLTPGDPSTVGEWPLTFTGVTLLNGNEVSLDDRRDGKLTVRRRFVYLNRAEVAAGTDKPVPMVVKATFDAPPGVDGYRLNAYQIHLTWDPSLLELQPVLEADQKGTAVFGRGSLILPDDSSLERSRATGHLRIAWLGFNLTNGQAGFLLPGTDLNLFFLSFKPLLPTTTPTTFAPVHFVLASLENCHDGIDNDGDLLVDAEDPDCAPVEICDNKIDDDGDKLIDSEDPDCPLLVTALLPEKSVLNVRSLETGIDGGIQINSSATRPISLQTILPARGSLLGGHTAELFGTGFLFDGRKPEDFSVRMIPSGGGDPIPVTSTITVKTRHLRFDVPPLSVPPQSASALFDIEVTDLDGSVKLPKAFSYERPRLTGTNLSMGCASGGQKMILRGAGLAYSKDNPQIQTEVFFDVLDQSPPRRAEIDVDFKDELDSERWDGTWLPIRTPDLTGHDQAKITVKVGQLTAELPVLFQAVPDAVSCPGLTISPETASICGGEDATIKGKGFSSAPPSKVRFGDFDAPGPLTIADDRTLKVKTPKVPEGTGNVTVVLLGSGNAEVGRIPGGFAFLELQFLRGDVVSDGQVNLTDAIAILRYLAQGGTRPGNLDAADVDDNGKVDVTDAVFLLNFLFKEGGPPLAPFPQPGADPHPDNLTGCN